MVAESLHSRSLFNICHLKAGADERSNRDVEPYHMVNYDGEWYLIAYCRLKKKVLTFAVSRIESCEIKKEHYKIPDDFKLDLYLGEHFGISRENRSFNIEVEFTGKSAYYIRERVWHKSQRIRESDGDSIILSFTTNSFMEVKRWLLSWGPDAKVLAPEVLKKEIRDDLLKASLHYR